MSKFTDTIKAALKAYFETGDTPTEAQFAEWIDAIQAGIQEHDHAGVGGGDAAPITPAGLPAATETAIGAVELATIAEAHAGTDTTRAVVATGLLVRKIGTAILGGDLTGNVRGANALDIQSERSTAAQVASGSDTVAIGISNTVSGTEAVAVGYGNTVTSTKAVAVGHGNIASGINYEVAVGYDNTASGGRSIAYGAGSEATGEYSLAVGYHCTASGDYTTAIGYIARARIPKTTNICGPQIIRKDDGEEVAFRFFCGVEVILMSKEVDLEVVADQTLTLPAGCKFWLNEIGLIATSIDTLTVQPTIRFGITGDLDKHMTAALTTAITATGKREIETPLVPEDGETSLTAGVTITATATTALGRFYWKGMLIEDE